MNVIVNTKTLLKLLRRKDYEGIYNKLGKRPYVLFADIKYKKQDINELLKNNDYVTLYKKYGIEEPLTYKIFKKHIQKLISNGKYMDIINICGYDFYNKNKYKIIKEGIFKETGNTLKAMGAVFKEKTKECFKDSLKYACTIILTLNFLMPLFRLSVYNDSVRENKELLEEYNQRIDDYTDYIKSLNIDNDLDLVMKIIYDMWNEMDGYGNAKNDPMGIYRIAFADVGSAGVCRNIADDFSARLNRINPKYDSRTLVVDGKFEYYEEMANIDRRYATEYENTENNEGIDFIGNHMVSTFKPTFGDYTLVVDPTNPVIGIIVNGKIYVFSGTNGKGLEYKPLGQAFISIEKSFGKIEYEFMKSAILHTSIDKISQLDEIWGIEAQNKSLDKIKKY